MKIVWKLKVSAARNQRFCDCNLSIHGHCSRWRALALTMDAEAFIGGLKSAMENGYYKDFGIAAQHGRH
jgi:hypothetical protein